MMLKSTEMEKKKKKKKYFPPWVRLHTEGLSKVTLYTFR